MTIGVARSSVRPKATRNRVRFAPGAKSVFMRVLLGRQELDWDAREFVYLRLMTGIPCIGRGSGSITWSSIPSERKSAQTNRAIERWWTALPCAHIRSRPEAVKKKLYSKQRCQIAPQPN